MNLIRPYTQTTNILKSTISRTSNISKRRISKQITPCTLINSKRFFSLTPDFSKLKLNKTPAGGVIGDVNEPFKINETNFYEGSYHWQYEHIITITLLPLTGYSLYAGLTDVIIHPLIDASLCTSYLLFVYYELVSCITDYIPKRKFGVWNTFARYLLSGGTALSLYGIYELETNGNGFVELLKSIWKKEKYTDFDSKYYE
ncbi:hypothetical protein TBLA_0D00870 [Henningerozyma blattae CBS 6284]|uniref:Succinate dehydrogenase [ubiquinone] cytochrome b small subunit n=1 Tax=Henningerozyma blattae (strain ATCC 34711 / CBS 6284 / DSM 70876 / NBRC 10599 / NRRL Y-10934 / UCD 77-7) TaxID=1071380 RepID=I2H2J3_HENB6|nr:hypothetical protein TBLA_0D00870 [Tetrapisispora blattae CBS 6284]CCH60595.1 hypothetical protein TBLA_0D00870 [Tetrapisispora blattae CBS 6284]